MCDKAILENAGTSKFLTATKIKKSILKPLKIILMHQNMFPNAIRLKKYVMKLNMFLNAIRLKKYVMEKFIDAFLYLILFLINIKPKKYVI